MRGLVHNGGMNDPQTIDPRRRIRELMSIPERDRTDEQWDELNELEIRTAPGNRESDRSSDRPMDRRPNHNAQGRRPDRNQGPKNTGPSPLDGRALEGRPQEARSPDSRPPKKQHRRPKRPVETTGTG